MKDYLKKIRILYNSTIKLREIINEFYPNLLIGCIPQLAWLSFLFKIDSLFFAEDDFHYTFLQGLLTYPFVKYIISPLPVRVGPFNYKKISYLGYHKLAYLHPNYFSPDVEIKNKYIQESNYFLIRSVSLSAYHDMMASGINYDILKKTLKILGNYGSVYISSEKKLPPEFERHLLKINPNDIHHIMAFANLYIGDSQSMAVEAALLGVPGIRFNNFTNKISVLNELENDYKLTYSVNSNAPNELYELLRNLLESNKLKSTFINRREKLLTDKIDVTQFMIWLIENYPCSIRQLKENPEIQERFR